MNNIAYKILKSTMFICVLMANYKGLIDVKAEENSASITSTNSLGGMSLLLDEHYEYIDETGYYTNLLSGQIYIKLDVPKDNAFKSYMSYKAITNKSSKQYELQQYAYTDYIGLRCIDGRICIAVGTYYGDIGDKLDIVMKNGAIFECIIGDIKDNRHTDKTNRQHTVDKSVVEFIVDTSSIPILAKKMGNISYAHEDFKGEIDYIRKYINDENNEVKE